MPSEAGFCKADKQASYTNNKSLHAQPTMLGVEGLYLYSIGQKLSNLSATT